MANEPISVENDQYDLVELFEEIDEDDLNSQQTKEFVAQKKRLESEIEDLRRQLLSRLSHYESAEKQYRIAVDQYRNLQTLNSIEQAITASRNVMLSRNEVLEIYQNLLRLTLINTEGVELSHKRQALSQLEENRELLAKFKLIIEQSQDRDDINNLAVSFVPLGAKISETSYYALSILSIGRLQSVYDRILVVNRRLVADFETNPDVKDEAGTRRSFNEINKLLTPMPARFESVWTLVDDSSDTGRGSGFTGLHQGLTRQLSPIYTSLSRTITYLEEVGKVK